MRCIEHQSFDTEAFGIPWYRVVRFDTSKLPGDVRSLAVGTPVVIDAKVPAEEFELSQVLLDLGFRRVCTQVKFRRELRSVDNAGGSQPIVYAPSYSDDVLWAHARNFRCDRFSQDARLPLAGRDQLYYRWIKNSLVLGEKTVVSIGDSFCSFSVDTEGPKIDLISVLRHGAGIGSALLDAVFAYGVKHEKQSVTVVTECENRPAWGLYAKKGFEVAAYLSVFHYVDL